MLMQDSSYFSTLLKCISIPATTRTHAVKRKLARKFNTYVFCTRLFVSQLPEWKFNGCDIALIYTQGLMISVLNVLSGKQQEKLHVHSRTCLMNIHTRSSHCSVTVTVLPRYSANSLFIRSLYHSPWNKHKVWHHITCFWLALQRYKNNQPPCQTGLNVSAIPSIFFFFFSCFWRLLIESDFQMQMTPCHLSAEEKILKPNRWIRSRWKSNSLKGHLKEAKVDGLKKSVHMDEWLGLKGSHCRE